ncbi:copper resistance D family protein [Gordonia neofelifaecis]|uniref:Copper resistance D domain protein n=1 Tax=Gordonia neofelifaecis NRRL B-59395 TaxID=644548 RepID=F1YKH2_9ACTN|nr:CopD family protein [Gordonia neofelifaecis]EGD54858.1 copper resistance D domain protein [Gordonia neofelifaecis NRRL B-59395]
MTGLTIVAASAGGTTPPLRQILTVFAYFLALALATGLTLALSYLLPKNARGSRIDHRLRSFALPIGVLVLVAGYFQYVNRIVKADIGYTWAQAVWPTHLLEFLRIPRGEDMWASAGVMGTVQLLSFLALAVILFRTGSTSGRGLPIAGFWVAIFAAACPSLTLASLDLDTIANRELKLVHILAGMIWVGGILVLASASLLALRGPATDDHDVDAAGAWDHMWSKFSVWAMGTVIGVTLSGLWLAWVHLGSFGQFVTTPYGRFLLVKLLLVAYMVAAGAYNALVLIPGLRRARLAGDDRRYTQLALAKFPRIVVGEALAAVAILVIVPFLSGSARKQAGGAAAGPFDWGTFGLGLTLLILAVLTFTTTVRSIERRDGHPAGAAA